METELEILEDNEIFEEVKLEFSEIVLNVQQQLNNIQINEQKLEENGLYNDETKKAIMKLQSITNFIPNGVIDQNLMFRLNEIIENPIITEYNQSKTFAVLYSKYKESF